MERCTTRIKSGFGIYSSLCSQTVNTRLFWEINLKNADFRLFSRVLLIIQTNFLILSLNRHIFVSHF